MYLRYRIKLDARHPQGEHSTANILWTDFSNFHHLDTLYHPREHSNVLSDRSKIVMDLVEIVVYCLEVGQR